MGAVWGIVSGKFAITAAGLLVASRIDQGRLQAAVDPRVATSTISRTFSDRHHLGSASDPSQTTARRPLSIGIGGEEFDQRSLSISGTNLPTGTDLIIGRDILVAHVFEIDMKRRVLTLLERSEVDRLSRSSVAVPIELKDNGSLTITIAINGVPTQADVDLSQADGVEISSTFRPSLPDPAAEAQIQIGSVVLRNQESATTARDDASVSLGLLAFEGRTIVLDLPHGKLWISGSVRDGQ